MNGYIKILIEKDAIFLQVNPPTVDGEAIKLGEITSYLTTNNINFDISTLMKEYKKSEEVYLLPLLGKLEYPQNEMFIITISDDKMTAMIKFFPPSNGGKKLSKDNILIGIKGQGIKVEIENKGIDQFLAASQKNYCTNFVLAKGNIVKQGTVGYVEYMFNTKLVAKPTELEDGSVDFFNLNVMNHCEEGGLLAQLHQSIPGQMGFNVLNEKVKPADVPKIKLRFGKNIRITQEEDKIYAEIHGHVNLIEDRVVVSNIYEVQNIDTSTGNIDYDGSIVVKGNVQSNFVVKAKGNIEILGVVEGAHIEAEGNIIIEKGINGINKAVIQAGGNVVAKFIENAKVIAGGNVEAEAILHSDVVAKLEVNVLGKKGFIQGGKVSAGFAINVKNLGSPMGALTVAEVGVDPLGKKKLLELQGAMLENKKALDAIMPILESTKVKISTGIKLSQKQLEYFKQVIAIARDKKTENETMKEQIKELKSELGKNIDAYINVRGIAFTGSTVVISDLSIELKENTQFCKFVSKQGEISKNSL